MLWALEIVLCVLEVLKGVRCVVLMLEVMRCVLEVVFNILEAVNDV
jgi:hypothetical protein